MLAYQDYILCMQGLFNPPQDFVPGLEEPPRAPRKKPKSAKSLHYEYFRKAKTPGQRALVMWNYYNWILSHVSECAKIIDHWSAWCSRMVTSINVENYHESQLCDRRLTADQKLFVRLALGLHPMQQKPKTWFEYVTQGMEAK